MSKDLISRKALVAALIEERNKFPPETAERYSFGVKLPNRFNQAMRGGIRKALRLVETAAAINAEPVQHGRWIHTTKEDGDWGGTFHRYTCSACNWSMGDNPTGWGLFCPACGAKMDLEVQDD